MGNIGVNPNSLCITSYGSVTPMGNDLQEIYDNFINNLSGITQIKKFNNDYFNTHDAGIPKEGNETICWPKKSRFRNGELFYANLASKDLAKKLRLSDYYSLKQIGCIVGVDVPSIDIEDCINFSHKAFKEQDRLSLINAAVEHFKANDLLDMETVSVMKAIHNNSPFSGLSFTHLGLCCASTQSIGLSMRLISKGIIDAAICGGVSAKVTPFNLARLEAMDVISTDQNFLGIHRSRPFDRLRSGFVLAEGAIIFTIEKLSKVLSRGQQPLAYLLGYGGSLCAQHIVMPHQEELEMKLSMKRAIENSGLNIDDIDCINTHGTSTIQNDYHEAQAIKEVFGDNNPDIVATKSYHGHLIAAAGAMEILGIIVSFKKDFLPKILNCDEVDPTLPAGFSLVRDHKYNPLKYVLKNSFGMGGGAASLILGNPNYL